MASSLGALVIIGLTGICIGVVGRRIEIAARRRRTVGRLKRLVASNPQHPTSQCVLHLVALYRQYKSESSYSLARSIDKLTADLFRLSITDLDRIIGAQSPSAVSRPR